MKYIFTYLLIFMGYNFALGQSINPAHVINLCSNQTIQGTNPTTTIYNNLYTPCSTLPLSNAITLYYVEIESGSTFTFTVSPNANVDFDFASWLNPNLANLGPSDRGSQNTIVGINTMNIGLSLLEPIELCEGPGSAPPNTGVIPGMVRYYDVVPGDGILIALDHWESSVVSYSLSFGGDAVLNCTVIGKTYEVCDYDNNGTETFDLDDIRTEINNINQTFLIDFFENETDAASLTATNSLPSPYTVSINDSPKTVYARFRRANGLLARVTEVTFVVNEIAQLPESPLEIEVCDFDQTKDEYFDLTVIEPVINAENQTNPTYKYYETEQDAIDNNENFISNPSNYLSRTKTIYIQVSLNGKCPIVAPLRLLVDTLAFPPKSIIYSEFCAIDEGGSLTFDLLKSIEYFIDDRDLNDYEFTFYNNQSSAINKINTIEQPQSYSLVHGISETIYVRIENWKGCFILSELILDSKPRFVIADQYNFMCEPYILPPLPIGYRYYTEPNGQGKAIDPFSNEAIIYGKRTIYIYGNSLFVDEETPTFNQCTFETQFTVYNNDCQVPKGISPNGDGSNDFWDLTAFGITKLTIYNRTGGVIYTYGEGYTNQWYGQTNNGNTLPTGTYFYSFESINGPRTGWVQVILEVKQ